MRIPDRLLPLILDALHDHGILDGSVEMMAGWIYTESAFDQWAVRYEPAFERRYISEKKMPDLSGTERKMRSMSWGLLQIMGQVAREYAYTPTYLSELLDPRTNLDLAATILKANYNKTGSWEGALAAYNGGLGGNRREPYRNQYYVNKVTRNAEMF